MKKITLDILMMILIVILSLFIYSISVQAGNGDNPDDAGSPSKPVELTNPLTGKSGSEGYVSPQEFIGRIIKAILGIVGSLALVMFIYGGFNWMTAAGSPEKIEKGKSILVWATIGLIVIFTSYALVKFVFTSLEV